MFKVNNMEIKMDITASLSPDDVNKIITVYLEKQGFKVGVIKAKVGQRQCGDQRDSWTESYFEGFEAKVTRKD